MSRLVMAVERTKRENRTSERILDVAERLVQTRGFNNFSYADIAKELGITTASLHYHFRGKAELGQALITRYAERFGDALDRIDAEVPDARGKLEAYASLYAGVLEGERMCMCGVLAAEYQTLPEPMRRAVIGFFDENQRWLAGVLNQGQTAKTLAFSGIRRRGRSEHPVDARRGDACGSPLRRPGHVQLHRPPGADGSGELTGSRTSLRKPPAEPSVSGPLRSRPRVPRARWIVIGASGSFKLPDDLAA